MITIITVITNSGADLLPGILVLRIEPMKMLIIKKTKSFGFSRTLTSADSASPAIGFFFNDSIGWNSSRGLLIVVSTTLR